jgi:hypothetical protein
VFCRLAQIVRKKFRELRSSGKVSALRSAGP